MTFAASDLRRIGALLPRRAGWWQTVCLLALVRVAIAVAAYGAKGSALPDMPAISRPSAAGGLQGDATGFYAAARESMAAWGYMPRPILVLDVLFVLSAAVAIVHLWRRRGGLRPWLAPAALLAAAVALCADIHWMKPTGAAVFGWPLIWSLPMYPYRLFAHRITESGAWDIGTTLSLIFEGATVVAVAWLARNASGRRSIGLFAAALWTAWPLIVGLIAGHHGWTNDQWAIDVGLHNYDEPLSTLLVTAAVALLAAPGLTPMRLSLAGCALSVATAVKVSNALLLGAALAIVLLSCGLRRGLPYLAGALSFAPAVLAYWPISYPKLYGNPHSWPHDPFDTRYIISSWTQSSIFTPHTLALITPLAFIGAFAIRRPWPTALTISFLLVNPIFYSFFANTAEHPRFLYASIPELATLSAVGIGTLTTVTSRATHARWRN